MNTTPLSFLGDVTERLIVPVLRTGEGDKPSEGSNPSIPAELFRVLATGLAATELAPIVKEVCATP